MNNPDDDLAEVGRIWREEPERQEEAVAAYERKHGVKLEECGECRGTGQMWCENIWGEMWEDRCEDCMGNSLFIKPDDDCAACDGRGEWEHETETGERYDVSCHACNGAGIKPDDENKSLPR